MLNRVSLGVQDPRTEKDDMGDYLDMAVSFNNKFVVLFTSKGHIWMGSSDLMVRESEVFLHKRNV